MTNPNIPRLAREVLSYERTQYEGRVPTAAEQLARYVEDTAAIVEAAVAHNAAFEAIWDPENTEDRGKLFAECARSDRVLSDLVRAYRAKWAT